MKLSKYIDHTLLKADASLEAIGKLCEEAREYDFKSVCVNTCNIPFCKKQLEGSDVLVCCVIGFPLGAMSTEAKVFEAMDAIAKGADEVDMVINIGRLKDKDYDYVTEEIRKIKETVGDKTLKVIIETCLLTDEEKVKACE
ncbi:MAG: deoxyribose-phosphate aldolase, partial [Erysipelotrichaceae bacterium]|nr:deoxyribose-phosphate aldolase [Erysipelotrichaceae bacterium]